MVVGFIRGRCVNSLGSLGLSGVFEFNCMRPGCHWGHPVSLGSLARDLGVVGLIRCSWVHLRAPLGSVVVFIRGLWIHSRALGFMQRCWVHSCAPLGLIGSSGVVGFILGRSIHSRASWGSLG